MVVGVGMGVGVGIGVAVAVGVGVETRAAGGLQPAAFASSMLQNQRSSLDSSITVRL